MAVLGVLLGITMCALIGVCLYGRYKINDLSQALIMLTKQCIEDSIEMSARFHALEKRRELPDSDEPKNPRIRARTMSDAIREMEQESANPMKRRT